VIEAPRPLAIALDAHLETRLDRDRDVVRQGGDPDRDSRMSAGRQRRGAGGSKPCDRGRPIPDAPPVTSAAFPFILRSSHHPAGKTGPHLLSAPGYLRLM